MQIIQGIREKGAAITIAVIALALIAFILMDAKPNSGGRSSSSTIGKVDGSSIELDEFNKRVKMQESQEEQRSGSRTTTGRSAQIREEIWNRMVAEKVFYAEADKLGIDFTSKELSALLSSNDPANPFLQEQEMIDPATGKLDLSKVAQALTNIKKMKGEQRDAINAQVVDPARLTSVSSKYMALLNGAAYYPAWMEEKDNKESKAFASISYVSIPYATISDSAVKVTNEDVEKYIGKNKDLFKQEEGRMISYVAFSQLPNGEDSTRVKDAVTALKDAFAAETNMRSFIARNTSTIDFDSNYKPKSKIPSSYIDSIIKTPTGVVFGPYVDRGSYVMARVLGSKTLPDSVKARHILIPTVDPQTGQPIMEDSVAKKRADSLFAAIKAGGDFIALAKQFSSDGSKDKGGDLGTFGYGAMVAEFNNYCFNNPVGSRDVVRTQFGYHIIEIVNQKGASPAYKIAFLGKEILASEATINSASLAATKFATDKDPKNFDTTNLKKKGLMKITVPSVVKENDAQVGQLQEARQLVRWVFEAKKGDISDPYSIGDQFVVATVEKIYKEGVQDAETARPIAEAAIRNLKKGEEIIKKLGNAPTLESAAAAYGKQVSVAGADSSLMFTSKLVNEIGQEPKVFGASFNKENQAKVSAPITGKSGVFVLKVNSIGTKAADTPDQVAQRKKQQTDELRNQGTGNWFEALRKAATIKDNRSKFY